ncbi:hypothetical protein F5Y16DRAFT_403493 [Xylariaceae sp. FL0255]|nr:hypothetical protein F5Y16DRAFT_403493 [Xylariaceae sp. FL0255]
MAKIQAIRGLEVSIEIGKKRAAEYDARQPSQNKSPSLDNAPPHGHVENWISVKNGDEPVIVINKTPEFSPASHHIGVVLFIDQHQHELIHEPPSALRKKKWETGIEDLQITSPDGNGSVVPFKIMGLNRVEAETRTVDEHEADVKRGKKIGRIRVTIHRMLEHRIREYDNEYDHRGSSNHATISEDIIKDTLSPSHCIGTGEPRDVDPDGCVQPEYEDDYLHENALPFAIFDFFYRSGACLMAEGLATRRQLDEAETMSMDDQKIRAARIEDQKEIRRLRRLLEQSEEQRIKQEQLNIKRERSAVKRETSPDAPSSNPRRRRVIGSLEVRDLEIPPHMKYEIRPEEESDEELARLGGSALNPIELD